MDRIDTYNDSHPIGRSIGDDKNCCTVVSLSCVTGRSFEQCNKYLSKFGRRFMGRLSFDNQILAFEAPTKFKTVKSPYTMKNRITIKKFIEKHSKGKFYCCSRGHAFAIIDGVLYDHSDKPRRQIVFCYRFFNEDDLKILNDFKNKLVKKS